MKTRRLAIVLAVPLALAAGAALRRMADQPVRAIIAFTPGARPTSPGASSPGGSATLQAQSSRRTRRRQRRSRERRRRDGPAAAILFNSSARASDRRSLAGCRSTLLDFIHVTAIAGQ
jgi:hypothetical protein